MVCYRISCDGQRDYLSVICLSVTGWCSVETAEQIKRTFDTEAALDLPYTVW